MRPRLGTAAHLRQSRLHSATAGFARPPTTCPSPKLCRALEELIYRRRPAIVALDDDAPTPRVPASPFPDRRSSPARPRKPRPPAATRRLQAGDAQTEAPHNRPPVLDLARQSVEKMETVSRHRHPGHRPAVAAATLPRVLDPPFGSAQRRPPPGQRQDRRTCQDDGRGESLVGCAAHPRRAPEARPRGVRAHRIPLDPKSALPAVPDLAHLPR